MTIVNASSSVLSDQFGRIKRKLRISVTDRCNFKCVYCMPEHPEWIKKQHILSFEALYLFCELMVEQGIQSIRITGGEPLMRQGVVHFIARLNHLRQKGLKRISMTTNGHYLADYALALKQAGLDDINISLDSLDAKQFEQITQKQLIPVLVAIQAVQQVEIPIKINTVLIKGLNDDQIIPLIEWAITQQVALRFIEFMPLDGDAQWQKNRVVTEADIVQKLTRHYHLQQLVQHSEPARNYLLDGRYVVGIISTVSHSFCADCDRVRLTAKGEFYSCLFATQGMSVKADLEHLLTDFSEVKQQQLIAALKHAIWYKHAGYQALQQRPVRKISMHALGG